MRIGIILATALAVVATPMASSTPTQAGDGGAIAAGVLGGLAAGAIIGGAAASASRPVYVAPEPVYVERAPTCFARREVWSERHQGYVVRRVRVPC
ncbi:MAG: hypothetical protein AB7K04_12305 [Pseudorhodoplanes sp.]